MTLKDKILKAKKDLTEKRSQYNTLITDAATRAESGDLDKAKEIKKQIDDLKAEIENLQATVETLEEIAGLKPEEDKKDPAADPAKDPAADPAKAGPEEQRSLLGSQVDMQAVEAFGNYIKSQGEERSALTSADAGVVIPEQVVTRVKERKETGLDLTKMITEEPVTTGSGTYPAAKRTSMGLLTKEEAALIEDVDKELFIPVEWKVATYAGKLILAQEALDDSAINLADRVSKHLETMRVNTDNRKIVEILKTFTKVPATTVDDLKTVANVALDPALVSTVVVNQSAYNELDKLKDKDGRYLLQPNISSPSGYSFLGKPVVIIPDVILPNGGTAANPKYPIFIGDLEEAVFKAKRSVVTAKWTQFDSYTQGLAITMRADYKQIDPDACRYIEFVPAAPATETPTA
jgi:uncharacterized protein